MHPSYIDSASRAPDPMADAISYPTSAHYIPPYYPPQLATGNAHLLAPPPRTEPQRRRPKYTRSKTGCMTCRVKKIKCDETKPNCIRCVHGQRECTWPEGVPQRKKNKKVETVDGRPSTAGSSGISDASTPPTRDNTPPKRERPELGLPPLLSKRHSEPFMHAPPHIPSTAETSYRPGPSMFPMGSGQQNYSSISNHPASNTLPIIPELTLTYHNIPPMDHRFTNNTNNNTHPYMPSLTALPMISRPSHGSSSYRPYDQTQSHTMGHWHQSSIPSHVDSIDTYPSTHLHTFISRLDVRNAFISLHKLDAMSSQSHEAATSDDVVASQPLGNSYSPPSANALPYTATIPNPWSHEAPTYRFGVAEERGPRRTMEDAHSYSVNYAGVHGQGFFAIFDGHAGKEAAEWCGRNFHEYMLQTIQANPNKSIPDIYNMTFHDVDRNLSKMTEESDGKIHSGCTAVAAFLRIEDAEGGQSFYTPSAESSSTTPPNPHVDSNPEEMDSPHDEGSGTSNGAKKESKLKKAIQRLSQASRSPSSTPRSQSPMKTTEIDNLSPPQLPPPGQSLRRVLYVANAGDARGVLCRSGRAVRLTYDHKGTDRQEAKRIMDSGGFVMSGRVNGVLAVTRSLGDSSMKDFVVGSPYTTETEMTEEDEFLILACDGIWDVMEDQAAVDFVRRTHNPQDASTALLKEALKRYTNDNITVMVIRLKDPPLSVDTPAASNVQNQ
ncbi:hypothetical protein EW146_g1299 [Bondarzewia mesenterica]|uniref:PPM-type phosphatase domain-containing protein n=1 Tax=Bondarzewia mesenterica TaxID=1095465 RepID=A0A4S4M4D3_9AGAM|nr:hypothetical protein EW146_g1299 [Bondarzewia mesenterica]